MDERVFNDFVEYIYIATGIVLKSGKEELLKSRIQKRMLELRISDYENYLNFVKKNSQIENMYLINAITTNVTSFFREPDHFEFLLKLVPQLVNVGINKLAIWSAACSSGEEVYTLSMVLNDAIFGLNAEYSILGSDISTRVLKFAEDGVYSDEQIKSVDSTYFDKYIKKNFEYKNKKWIASEKIRTKVSFDQINLAHSEIAVNGPLDIIFCRNAMIYFDLDIRQQLIKIFFEKLRPGGFLFIGHSESLAGIKTNFKSIRPSIYRKPA